jgi:effector-binding domain-containing protein
VCSSDLGTANALNEFIENNQLIIEGSILTIYSEIPSPEKKQRIFVGIPVNKKVKSTNWEYLTLPAGRFHKATTNAEIGATIPLWNTVSENLTKAGYTIKMPIYEYPSDGRNFEMTTTVSQVNLLIPVSK